MSNQRNTALYVGITNNLDRRVREHKEKIIQGFTKKYNLCKLLYFEQFLDVRAAISREKQLKGGSRLKKVNLIMAMNPGWIDLALSLRAQRSNP